MIRLLKVKMIDEISYYEDILQRHNYSKKTISAIKRDGALIINRHPVTVRYMLKKMINLLLNCGRSSKYISSSFKQTY